MRLPLVPHDVLDPEGGPVQRGLDVVAQQIARPPGRGRVGAVFQEQGQVGDEGVGGQTFSSDHQAGPFLA